jgi:hypothetical protein
VEAVAAVLMLNNAVISVAIINSLAAMFLSVG